MAADVRNKEIQVQKPAQSLEHFQAKVASGDDLETGILRQLLIGLGAVAVLGLTWVGVDAWMAKGLERHESALAEVLAKVEGPGGLPLPAAELETRMRENLPALEALAKSAPSSRRAVVQGLAASWKLQLEGRGAAPAVDLKDPWARIREGQRLLSRGEAEAAAAMLEPLRKSATPGAPWGQLWWATRLDVDRLKVDRTQALKDVAEYKAQYKGEADSSEMDKLLAGI